MAFNDIFTRMCANTTFITIAMNHHQNYMYAPDHVIPIASNRYSAYIYNLNTARSA